MVVGEKFLENKNTTPPLIVTAQNNITFPFPLPLAFITSKIVVSAFDFKSLIVRHSFFNISYTVKFQRRNPSICSVFFSLSNWNRCIV